MPVHATFNRFLSFALLCVLLGIQSTQIADAQELVTFASWKTRCLKTPANRVLRGRMPPKKQLPLADFAIAQSVANQLLKQYQTGPLATESNWVGTRPKEDEFFDIERSYYQRPPISFQPFAQKAVIPAGSKVIYHGDFHGDIRSFISSLVWLNDNDYMDGFKFKDANTYFVFLGDYVDRGSYGVEVLYTLMRLKLANPNQVFMTRGNHEDFEMTARYGFLREGQMKYGKAFDPLPLWRVYDFLPVVLYLGVGENYMQCNHGGMEPGFNPRSLLAVDGKVRFQLLGEIAQKTFAKENPNWLRGASQETLAMAGRKLANFTPRSPTSPQPIGFMWNDYFVFGDEPVLGFNESRLAFNHGKASTDYLMNVASSPAAKLRTVFRAHQHSSVPNPAMNRLIASRGAFRHWQASDSLAKANENKEALRASIETASARRVPDASVWTLNVSPDSVYGAGNDYAFDTIGILSTADEFDDWRLRVVNIDVPVN